MAFFIFIFSNTPNASRFTISDEQKHTGKIGNMQNYEQWISKILVVMTACQQIPKYSLQKNLFTRLFPSVPFSQSPTGQVCVCQCESYTVVGSVCDFFQTGDWKWGRSHYAGRITQSTPKWGAGACQHTCMCAFVCFQMFVCATGVQPVTFFQWVPHDLFTVPLSHSSLHTDTWFLVFQW